MNVFDPRHPDREPSTLVGMTIRTTGDGSEFAAWAQARGETPDAAMARIVALLTPRPWSYDA